MMDALEEPYRFAGEFDANGFVQNLMSAGSYLLLVWVRNQISKNYTDVHDDDIEILD